MELTKNVDCESSKILLVEDSPTEAAIIEASLEDSEGFSFDVTIVDSLSKTIECLSNEQEEYDVIVLDLTLPDSNGTETFNEVHKQVPGLPIVVLTANNNKNDAIETVRNGAQDYIVKERVEKMQLSLSIKYAIERKKAELAIQRANEELRDFAHIVSHDLKAPLRSIGGLVNILVEELEDKLDDKNRELSGLLIKQVERMKNLIDGILKYSKIGRVSEEVTKIDLNDLLNSIIGLIAPPDNMKVETPQNMPTIEANETQISQIFMNLLSNAIKYMDKPQGNIVIKYEDNGKFWKFSVTDNGPGIEEKDFEKVFGMFQTLKPKDDYESTGVGLALIKKIVETHGGKIWVESELTKGSSFIFTLPKAIKHHNLSLQDTIAS